MRPSAHVNGAANTRIFWSRARQVYQLFLILAAIIQVGPLQHGVAAENVMLGHAFALGGISGDVGHEIAVDSSGDVYCAGSFSATVDLDPGPGTYPVSDSSFSDIYLCKFTNSGVFVWANVISGSQSATIQDISVDHSGNLYCTGFFYGTATFGTTTLSSVAFADAYICKLDPAGGFVWALSLGGSDNDYGYGICFDSVDNVYVTGLYRQTVDFDPGPGVLDLTSAAIHSAFVLKMNPSGGLMWAKSTGGTGYSLGADIDTDPAGDVYVAGRFVGTTDFDPGPGVQNQTSHGNSDIFTWKLSSDGDHRWSTGAGGTASDWAEGLAVDDAGNLVCTGVFDGAVDFDPGPGTTTLNSGNNSRDAFVLKLDSAGQLIWAQAQGGIYSDGGLAISLDSAGNIYSTGYFWDTADFGPGPNTTVLTGMGRFDLYVCKLGPSGALLWTLGMGSGQSDAGNDIVVDDASNVHVTGEFQETIDFDPGPGTLNLTSLGGYDAFVLKLESNSLPEARDDMGQTNADQLLVALSAPHSSSLLANDTGGNTITPLFVSTHDPVSTLGASVHVNANGTFVYDPTSVTALLNLEVGDSMLDTFTYVVSDGTNTDTGTVRIEVYGPGTRLPVASGWGLSILAVALLFTGARSLGRQFRPRS